MTQPGSAYSLEKREEKPETHTMSVLVDNEPGVLARVIGLFSGRGYNIDSLTVSETEHEAHLSRITIVTSGPPLVIEQKDVAFLALDQGEDIDVVAHVGVPPAPVVSVRKGDWGSHICHRLSDHRHTTRDSPAPPRAESISLICR